MNKKLLPWLQRSYLCPGLAVAGLAFLVAASSLLAQTAGDYRSAASGNWSSSGIWQSYDGSSWAAASAAPDPAGIGNLITVRSPNLVTNDTAASIQNVVVQTGATLVVPDGNSLTVIPGSAVGLDVAGRVLVTSNAQLTLNASAVLNAEGPGLNLDIYGSFTNSGTYQDAGMIGSLGYHTTNIVVEGGGMYYHNLNGGAAVTANWKTNSVIEVNGITTGDSKVSNLAQPIWDFNWNCPAQSTASFGAGTDGSLTNVLHNLNIKNAHGTSAAYVRFYIAPGMVMKIGGDLSISNCQAYFGTVHTPTDGTPPSLIYLGGDFIQGYYGQWRENNTHPYSNIDCLFYLTDGKPHRFISSYSAYWSKSAFSHAGFSTIEENSWVLGTNATFDMGTNILNPWSFTNYPGSTLVLADPYGICTSNANTGNLQPQYEGIDATWPVEGFNYFDPNASYVYAGSVPQYTGEGLPSTVANLTINNSAGVQINDFFQNTSLVAVTNMLKIQSGSLDLQGSTPTISGLSGAGSVTNGAVTMADSGLGLMPGAAGVAGTQTFDDTTLSFGTTTKSTFDLSGSTASGNDRVIVTGTGSMAANGATITINPLAPLAAADYVLFDVQGTGSVQSDFKSTPAWAGTPPSYAANYTVITRGKQVLLHYASVVVPPAPVTSFSIAPPIGGNCTLSYAGGAGSAFVLVGSANVKAPLSSWTPVKTNTASPGTFTIPISSAPATFYRVRSQ
jgi:hypothetical protein